MAHFAATYTYWFDVVVMTAGVFGISLGIGIGCGIVSARDERRQLREENERLRRGW